MKLFRIMKSVKTTQMDALLRRSTVHRCVTVLDLRCREAFFKKKEISGGGEGGVFLFLSQLQFSPLKTLQERKKERNLSSPAMTSHEDCALVTMTNMELITLTKEERTGILFALHLTQGCVSLTLSKQKKKVCLIVIFSYSCTVHISR